MADFVIPYFVEPTITVDYEEVSGSPTADSYTISGGHQGTRVFRCNWLDRYQFMNDMLGVTEGVMPASFPGQPFSRINSIGSVGETTLMINAPSDIYQYEKAIVTANYQSANIGQNTDGTMIEESLEPSAIFLALDSFKIFWDNPGTICINEAEAPQKIIRMVDWNVTLYNIRALPSGLITQQGDVNNAAITSQTLGVTFPTETLQYMGGSPSRTWMKSPSKSNFKPLWKLFMKFSAKKESWNLFYRRGYATPQPLYAQNPTSGLWEQFKPYDQSDFTALNAGTA